MKTLASRDNPRIRLLLRLASGPRAGRKAGLALLDGVHLLRSLLAAGGRAEWGAVTEQALLRAEVAATVAESTARGTEWFMLPADLFNATAPTAHPSGLLSVMARPPGASADMLLSPADRALHDAPFLLLLDAIQDPGNLGTLLRSAQGSDVTHVVLGRGCADVWAPRVLRAGMGAHFGLQLFEDVDLPAVVRARGNILGAAGEASVSAWEIDLAAADGLVIGNEGAGLSAPVRSACAQLVAIPLAPGCESLNASVAGSVLLFERARQKRCRSSLAS